MGGKKREVDRQIKIDKKTQTEKGWRIKRQINRQTCSVKTDKKYDTSNAFLLIITLHKQL